MELSNTSKEILFKLYARKYKSLKKDIEKNKKEYITDLLKLEEIGYIKINNLDKGKDISKKALKRVCITSSGDRYIRDFTEYINEITTQYTPANKLKKKIVYTNKIVLNSYCIFCDILGFSKEIQNHKSKYPNEHLNELCNAINIATSDLQENESGIFEIKTFTDNIVIGTPIKNLHPEEYFGLIILDIIMYQVQMILRGFFIRGGWSIGNLYMDDNIVYGESIIEAYGLESGIANYPRIILSDDMKKMIEEHVGYYNEIHPPQIYHVLEDENGKYFINYLYAIIADADYGYPIQFEYLKNHKCIVENQINRFSNESYIREKYEWSAFYHNRFCDIYIKDCPKEYYIDEEYYNKRGWEIKLISFKDYSLESF